MSRRYSRGKFTPQTLAHELLVGPLSDRLFANVEDVALDYLVCRRDITRQNSFESYGGRMFGETSQEFDRQTSR